MSALDILNNDRYILFIKGITQQNCIDKNDIVDNIYKNNSDDVFYSYIHDVYDKMPKVFSTLNVWPKSSRENRSLFLKMLATHQMERYMISMELFVRLIVLKLI
mgnify:CR=1 FL=1